MINTIETRFLHVLNRAAMLTEEERFEAMMTYGPMSSFVILDIDMPEDKPYISYKGYPVFFLSNLLNSNGYCLINNPDDLTGVDKSNGFIIFEGSYGRWEKHSFMSNHFLHPDKDGQSFEDFWGTNKNHPCSMKTRCGFYDQISNRIVRISDDRYDKLSSMYGEGLIVIDIPAPNVAAIFTEVAEGVLFWPVGMRYLTSVPFSSIVEMNNQNDYLSIDSNMYGESFVRDSRNRHYRMKYMHFGDIKIPAAKGYREFWRL